jgi:hypothetical protein
MAPLARWIGGAVVCAVVAGLALAIGRPAIEVQSPRAGDRIGVEGLELLARFPPERGVEPSTVRVLLNGADVTAGCVAGRNGVHGRLYGLLDGENRLRVEAFARGPAGLWIQESRDVRVHYRRPVGFDRG